MKSFKSWKVKWLAYSLIMHSDWCLFKFAPEHKCTRYKKAKNSFKSRRPFKAGYLPQEVAVAVGVAVRRVLVKPKLAVLSIISFLLFVKESPFNIYQWDQMGRLFFNIRPFAQKYRKLLALPFTQMFCLFNELFNGSLPFLSLNLPF